MAPPSADPRPSPPDLPPLPIFVYGTLRPGEKNFHRFLGGRTRKVEQAMVAGRLYFVRDEGYPYLLPGPGRVRGELIHLEARHYLECLRTLDALEEYDPADEAESVYLRRRAMVRTESGKEEQAWVYYWNLEKRMGDPIPSGDFRDRPPRTAPR